jgi:hypothetical protein
MAPYVKSGVKSNKMIIKNLCFMVIKYKEKKQSCPLFKPFGKEKKRN